MLVCLRIPFKAESYQQDVLVDSKGEGWFGCQESVFGSLANTEIRTSALQLVTVLPLI